MMDLINASEQTTEAVRSPDMPRARSEARNSSNYFAEKAGEDLDALSQQTDTTQVPQELQEDVDGGLGCWQTFRFFVKHSIRDVKRRQCHFCLGLCSVLIVVLSTLVVNTVVAKGPIIFMKLAQQDSGEIDCVYTATSMRRKDSNYLWQDNWSLNYTQAQLTMEANDVEAYLSPRQQICPPNDQITFHDKNGEKLSSDGTMCLKMIDTEQEKSIDLGVSWPYEKLQKGECIIAVDFASDGVEVGDQVEITVRWVNFWNNIGRNSYNPVAEANGWPLWTTINQGTDYGRAATTSFKCTVRDMISDTYGKMPEAGAKSQIIMEYEHYMDIFAESTTFNQELVDPELSEKMLTWMLTVPELSYHFAAQIIANMPHPRYEAYENSNFQDIQDGVLGYLYPITNYLGLYEIGTDLNLLFAMEKYSYAVLFIGLIFDVLLLIFVVVSCLLIYSLLLISVETKTFEIGVMRLTGLTKCGFIGMIMTQASLFVIPSVVLGFLLALPCTYFVYTALFSEDLGFTPSIAPGFSATVQALAIGILIPIFSSIIPIKRALSKNLTDSLSTQRKSTGIMITFLDNTSKNLVPYVIFGSISVAFGVAVYYFLPLGLLSMNYGMILAIFFAILLGMMAGLTLLATNLQGLLEIVLVYIFFFWERQSMRTLLRKNLGAHKQRNYLTSIIYALTLGCIIFLLVTASLEIQAISSANEIQNADIYLDGKINSTLADDVLFEFSDSIKDFGYVTDDIRDQQKPGAEVEWSDRANLNHRGSSTYGLSPASIIDESFPSLGFYKENITLPLTDQLYTARGAQGVAAAKANTDNMLSDIRNTSQTLLLQNKNFGAQNVYYQRRVLWSFDKRPNFGDYNHIGFLSIPMMLQMTQKPMDGIMYSRLLVSVHDPDDHVKIDEIAKALKLATKVPPILLYQSAASTEDVRSIIDLVFMVTIAIMMFLSFFSLSASMSANLYDQTTEIGVLRAMGVTRVRITLLYFYEALVLVFAACFLGILIGTCVAYTMMLQMDMFLNTDSAFIFPWLQTIEIFCLSLICAFFSTFGPTTQLTRKQISSIFRSA